MKSIKSSQQASAPKQTRFSGILVHPTSFPGPYGIGDLGSSAYAFIDFLAQAGQTLWQCLPLGPTGFGDSPYQSFSSFAGQPLLISPEKLVKMHLLGAKDLENIPEWEDETRIDYGTAIIYKTGLLKKAYENFVKCEDPDILSAYHSFCRKNKDWLYDYALFMSLKDQNGGISWINWPYEYKFPSEKLKHSLAHKLSHEIGYYRFVQFIFFRQWHELRAYAHAHDIRIIGDIPIFVSEDSADIWAHKELFQLNEKGFPTRVAGVPPDYFSATGQLWGNPLYDWEAHRETGYAWWIARIKNQLTLVDELRIDHFRGFESYWSVRYKSKTAEHGRWIPGPGSDFFDAVIDTFGKDAPIIAEDLGVITPEVEALRDQYHFPGMKVLQFAFDDPKDNAFLPHHYTENCICYTGTHDNDTSAGWYESATEISRDRVRRYMNCDGSIVAHDFIRTAMGSTARYAIFPMQDALGLGTEARMNCPGHAGGNWAWRFTMDSLSEGLARDLNQMTLLYGRNRPDNQPHTDN